MKKKIIVLILIIPVILIFTTNLVINTTPIIVNPPVKSIEVVGKKHRVIDLGDNLHDNKDLWIKVDVMPKSAKANITYKILENSERKSANVEVNNGKVIPHSTGDVTILVSAGDKSTTISYHFTSSLPVFKLQPGMTEDDVRLINFSQSEITTNVNSVINLAEYLPSEDDLINELGMFKGYKNELLSTSSLDVVDGEVVAIDDEFSLKLMTKKVGLTKVGMTYKYLLIDEFNKISIANKRIEILVKVES